MAIDWNSNEIMRELHDRLAKNVEAACIFATNEVKEVLNDTQPYERRTSKITGNVYIVGLEPSTEGNPPRKRIGEVQKGVTYQVDRENLAGKVGSPYDVAVYLELGTSKMAPRPYIRPTLLRRQAEIMGILGR